MSNNLVTPVSTVQYAFVKNEEIIHHTDGKVTPTGKYSITVSLNENDTQAFIEAIDKEWNEFLEKNGSGKEYNLSHYSMPTKVIDGKTYFVFRKNVSAVSKETNQPVKLYVPLFDSENKNCTKKIASIGRDSQVRISYSFFPFYMNANNYGVSLRLQAIQIVKLVPIASNGNKYGFGVVADGYVAQPVEDEVEIPY